MEEDNMEKARELAMDIAKILYDKGGVDIRVLRVDHLTSGVRGQPD